MTANGLSEKKNSILEINDLCFAYPEEKKRALNHVSLHVEDGEFLVLCGKSGCGKSTLLTHLKTPLTPHGKRKGEIFFQGVPIGEMSNREQSQRIGYVLQNPDNQIVTDKVWHELAFGLESLGYSNADIRIRVAEMASYFGIQDWFYKNVSELSGGQKQLLNLASIMAMHPDMLILDEPTSGLDPISRDDLLDVFMELIREQELTIFFSTHITADLEKCADNIIYIRQGNLYAADELEHFRNSYRLVQLAEPQLAQLPAEKLLGCKRIKTGYQALVRAADLPLPGVEATAADLDSIMVHLEKEGEQNDQATR